MLKHILLCGLLLGICGWAGHSSRAEEPAEHDAGKKLEELRIKEIAAKKNRQASYDVSMVRDLGALTPTQAARRLLPADAPLRVRWALPIHGASITRLTVPPQKANLRYFIVETSQLDMIAVRSDNGMPLWWVKLSEPVFGDVFFGEFNLYFTCGNRLICLERMSGDVQWNVALPFAPSAGPSAHEADKEKSNIFIPSLGRDLYCLDVVRELWPSKNSNSLQRSNFSINLAKPRILWQYKLAGICRHTPLYDDDNWLYVGSTSKRLYGINLRDATFRGSPDESKMWVHRSVSGAVAAPVTEGPHTIFPSTDQYLYCLTGGDGSPAWKYMAEEPLTHSPQLLQDDNSNRWYVIQRVGKNTLVGLNNKTGIPYWQHSKGMQIVGVTTDENQDKNLRLIAVSLDSDGHLSGILPSAFCGKSEKEIQEQLRKHPQPPMASVAWRLPIGEFDLFAKNNYGSFIFCTTKDHSTVCVLEKNR